MLSPMLWDFCESDDGEAVRAILASTRGYENVTYLANDSPTSSVVSDALDLHYDLKADKPATFRAWVELPDGGETDHEITATLTGEEMPIMGLVWEMEGTTVTGHKSSGTSHTKTAHLTLEFAPGQDAKEPHPKCVVTGGTVTYEAQSYTDAYFCSRSAPELSFELTGDMIPDTTSDKFWFIRLKFDTTVTPVKYWGII